MKNNTFKRGFAMVFVLMVLLVLSALGVGLLAKLRLTETSGIRWNRETQQEWDAQAGLEEACANFMAGNFAGFSASSGAIVTTTQPLTDEFLVTSVVAESDKTITLRQKYKLIRGPSTTNTLVSIPQLYIAGNGGSNTVLTLRNGVTVIGRQDGTIVFVDGNMEIGSISVDANTTIQASGSSTITNDQIYAHVTNEVDTAAVVAIEDKMDDYADMINRSFTNGTIILGATMDLLGETRVLGASRTSVYLTDSITILNGTLIVNGTLSGKNTSITLGPGANLLVGGDLDVSSGGGGEVIGLSDNVVYVGGDLLSKNHASYGSGEVYVEGDLVAKNNADISGLTYVAGTLEAKNGATLDGVVIAGALISKNNAAITLDYDKLPQWLLDLLVESGGGGGGTVIPGPITGIEKSEWTRTVSGS